MSARRHRYVLGSILIAAVAGAVVIDASVLPGLVTCVLVGGLAVLCAIETAAMIGAAGIDAFPRASLGAAIGVVAARVLPYVEHAAFPDGGLPALTRLTAAEIAMAGFFAFGAACIVRGKTTGAAQTLGAGALVIAVPAGLLTLVDVRFAGDGLRLLVFLIATSKVGDVAAYLVGSRYGKTKLAPSVSPGKTWVGAFASIVAATGLAALLAVVRAVPLSANAAVVAGIVINLASQLGDLLESLLKRSAGVKDSGKWLPEFGGAFDLVDSLVVAGPAFYGYLRLATPAS